ncbi:MAG: ABC transporter substrate-binding protein [Candidatus Thorarchaeota archaeon]
MASTRAKRIIAVSLVAAFTLMAFSPIFATAQAVPGFAKTGPYIDKLRFDVITSDDLQVLALQNDEIDLIDGFLDPSFIPALEVAENIQLTNVLRNGYGFVTLNTAKYPINYTAFRRALAFALDKNAISSEIFEGFSGSQDSPVPKQNGWSIEGQLPYTYYEKDVDTGNALLDAAGFDIDPETGFRTAPHGEAFDILVECASSSPIAIEVGAFIAAALNDMDVDATSEPTDFYEYLGRLNNHLDYDMCFLAWNFGSSDVDFLGKEWASWNADEPFLNFPNFRNDTYDSYIDDLLYSTDYQTVYDAAIALQEIWVYECPYIITYQNIMYHAWRDDRFEGHVNDWSDGVPGTWTNKKVHLKADQGGPFGGTFRWSNALDLDTFNILGASSAYTIQVIGEFYDSLMTLDDSGLDMMWLAESYTAETHADNDAIPDGHTRFTFQMLQNATWTDGMPLTAEDVAFSLNFLRDAPGNRYRPDLLDMSAAYAPSTYTVVVEFNTESYWHLHGVAFKPILPKHVMQEIVIEDWAEWNPNPPVEEMVTSGPFNISEYVAGEFAELTYNPNYFFGPDRTVETTTTTTTTTDVPPDFTMAIVAGAVGAAVVILVGGYVLMRQK